MCFMQPNPSCKIGTILALVSPISDILNLCYIRSLEKRNCQPCIQKINVPIYKSKLHFTSRHCTPKLDQWVISRLRFKKEIEIENPPYLPLVSDHAYVLEKGLFPIIPSLCEQDYLRLFHNFINMKPEVYRTLIKTLRALHTKYPKFSSSFPQSTYLTL